MALSPNYGWAEPDNSSLVKNGAQDIRALGDAIDTSVWNVGYGQAGKNKIINGDFAINQRAFTSATTNNVYCYDRFRTTTGGTSGTATYTAQTFTPGTAPVAGYEAKNFFQLVTASYSNNDSWAGITQIIESVRNFAGQTATISFWAKAGTGTPKLGIRVVQAFGTGGGASSAVNYYAFVNAISTSWARYSITFAIPSISGKTIGTDNNDSFQISIVASAGSTTFDGNFGSMLQNNTFQFWGVQVEYGSKATPFQTASGGSPQAELAMCQRYYYRASIAATPARFAFGYADSTTKATYGLSFPVQMRIAPTALEQSGTAGDYSTVGPATTVTVCSAVPIFGAATSSFASFDFTVTAGLVAGQGHSARPVNTSAFLGWSAEL
jgi:hypothetical protein